MALWPPWTVAVTMAARALFLDRDGVINIYRGYVHRVEDFTFVPGIFDLCRAARDLGFRLVVVTNQAGIARGYFEPARFAELTAWMVDRFAAAGTPLAAVMHCPYLAGGRPPFDRDSYWRKPNPGMMREAAIRLDLDLRRSILVGDQPTDMAAARAAGIGLRIGFGPDAGPDLDLGTDDLVWLARKLPELAGLPVSGVSSPP